MKKFSLFLLATCLLSVAAMAEDTSLTEKYGTAPTGGAKTSRFSFNGYYSTWSYSYARSKTSDKIGSDRAFWMNHKIQNEENCYLETTFEGGLKNVSFKWQQSATGDYPDNLYVAIKIDGTEVDHAEATSVNANIAANTYTHTFALKQNDIQFTIVNKSTTERANPTDIGRILIGPITFTPYLLYTQKDVTIGSMQYGYVNNELVDNTEEGTISYASSNEDVALVNSENGVITPVAVGTTTISAIWSEGVTTTYTLHVEDGIIVENFSKVAQHGQATTVRDWDGDLFAWKAIGVRRGTEDTIGLAPRIQATALRKLDGDTYLTSANAIEGGVKHIAFDWRQWASATSPLTISTYYSADNENWGDAVAEQSVDAVSASAPHVFDYDIDNGARGNAYFKLAYASGAGHAGMGAIKITPWLLYTIKEATLDLRVSSNTYVNTALINNTTGDAVVYSISDNTIGATIDAATGIVTAGTTAGEVTVTASWSGVSTSYKLNILAEGTPSAIENTEAQREIRKEFINGQLVISIDGVRYNMQGQAL